MVALFIRMHMYSQCTCFAGQPKSCTPQCFAALLLLYARFAAALHMLFSAALLLFTAALLQFYCCFTVALLQIPRCFAELLPVSFLQPLTLLVVKQQ